MKLRAQTEAAFTRQVLALARLYSWRSAHFRAGRTAKGWRTPVSGMGKGFPDLLLVGGPTNPPRVLAVELKSERGRLTPEQVSWLTAFRSAGTPAYCWRPSDFREIERVLKGEG